MSSTTDNVRSGTELDSKEAFTAGTSPYSGRPLVGNSTHCPSRACLGLAFESNEAPCTKVESAESLDTKYRFGDCVVDSVCFVDCGEVLFLTSTGEVIALGEEREYL